MSTNPLLQTIEALAKEKGIEPEVVIEAMEEAVLTASRKFYKTNEELKAKFNPDNGQIELFAVKTIVDEVTNPDVEISVAEARDIYGEDAEVEAGYQIEFPKRTDVLGRIAAQTVREAERENVFAEYNQRVGEVMSGVVKRFEQGDLIVEVGRVEAILPRKEQSRAESYAQGDRVRAVIRAVGKGAKGPQIVLSRTDPALLI
jgi:N utilization substance protein A